MTLLLKNRFASDQQEWETPDNIFGPLNSEFGFTIDVCAAASNTKCPTFFSKEDNALANTWKGICWMNPPFNEIGKWVAKAYKSAGEGALVVCLVPSRTNTNWWHEYCMRGEIRFIKGRPIFKGAKHGLPQPLSIVIFRPH
jgi:phage N-6-adenine-methyltransferase